MLSEEARPWSDGEPELWPSGESSQTHRLVPLSWRSVLISCFSSSLLIVNCGSTDVTVVYYPADVSSTRFDILKVLFSAEMKIWWFSVRSDGCRGQ